MIENENIGITRPFVNPDHNNPDDLVDFERFEHFMKDCVQPGEDPLEPVSDIYFPIFDNFDSIQRDPNKDPVVGGARSHILLARPRPR